MKVLILYDSRHGFTEHCLGLLAGELPPGVDLWPVRQRPGVPDWKSYDAVVLGGPVYFGRWAPRMTAFVARHRASVSALAPLGAFVVSLSPKSDALRYFSQSLPAGLKGKFGHVACFGGALSWKGLAWWERWLVRRSRGIETDVGNFELAAVQGLAAWLKSQVP